MTSQASTPHAFVRSVFGPRRLPLDLPEHAVPVEELTAEGHDVVHEVLARRVGSVGTLLDLTPGRGAFLWDLVTTDRVNYVGTAALPTPAAEAIFRAIGTFVDTLIYDICPIERGVTHVRARPTEVSLRLLSSFDVLYLCEDAVEWRDLHLLYARLQRLASWTACLVVAGPNPVVEQYAGVVAMWKCPGRPLTDRGRVRHRTLHAWIRDRPPADAAQTVWDRVFTA